MRITQGGILLPDLTCYVQNEPRLVTKAYAAAYLARIFRAVDRAEREADAEAVIVNGPVVHVESFYEAFEVKRGDRLFLEPAKRAALW